MNDRYTLICDDVSHELGGVALRLLRMGIDTLYADCFDEALLLADQEGARIRALIASPNFPVDELRRLRARVSRREGQRILPGLIVIGDLPDDEHRKALREIGAEWGLWELDDDASLRFVVNAAVSAPSERADRREPRIPTNLLASFRTGGARSNAVIYTLSARGAFLETPNPMAEGATLEVELTFADRLINAPAQVVHCNGLEQQRAACTPLGMGVVFEELPEGQALFLREFVAERAELFCV
ncbi:MAG TPA: PilZ domain-containing protein [Phycisphaerae bacterium]|nr:PilZ domain-containing protein [Phycisphaerae bacterium]